MFPVSEIHLLCSVYSCGMKVCIWLNDIQGDERSSEWICTIESAGNMLTVALGQSLLSCLPRQNFMAASETLFWSSFKGAFCV